MQRAAEIATNTPMTLFAKRYETLLLSLVCAAGLLLVGCTSLGSPGEHSSSEAGDREHDEAGEVAEVDRGSSRWRHRLAERSFYEGATFQMQEHYTEAIARYRDAIRRMPTTSGFHYAIARCFQKINRFDSALYHSHVALDLDNDNNDFRLLHADLLVDNGLLIAGVAEYEELIRREPGALQARYTVARILRQDEPSRAITHLEFLRDRTDDESVYLTLVEIYLAAGDTDLALARAQELAATRPKEIDYYFYANDLLLRSNRPSEAVALLAHLRAAVGNGLFLGSAETMELGNLLDSLRQGSTTAGLKRFTRDYIAEAATPQWPDPLSCFMGGQALYLLGDSATADSTFEVALTRTDTPDSLIGMTAALYFGDGHIQRGMRILEQTPRQRKNDPAIHLLLAEIYRQHERPQEAERSLKRSIAIRATASAWKELAILQGEGGRYIEGDRSWRRALALAPSDDAILSGFALSLGRRGIRLSEAKTMASRALRSDSLNPGHLLAAGVVELNRRDYDRGLRYIQRSTELDGHNPQAFEDLGTAWLALGNREEADKAWRRAEELDPNGTRIRSQSRTR